MTDGSRRGDTAGTSTRHCRSLTRISRPVWNLFCLAATRVRNTPVNCRDGADWFDAAIRLAVFNAKPERGFSWAGKNRSNREANSHATFSPPVALGWEAPKGPRHYSPGSASGGAATAALGGGRDIVRG